jgi:hypothetical protein
MSLRFRLKVGPFVYDETLRKPEPDRRPVLLTTGDLFVLALAMGLLVFSVVAAIWL